MANITPEVVVVGEDYHRQVRASHREVSAARALKNDGEVVSGVEQVNTESLGEDWYDNPLHRVTGGVYPFPWNSGKSEIASEINTAEIV
jgi:hypothetical protein